MKTETNFACDNYVCLTLTGIITSFADSKYDQQYIIIACIMSRLIYSCPALTIRAYA